MSAAATEVGPGVQRATAEHLLAELSNLVRAGMTIVAPAARALDAVLYPEQRVVPPFPGVGQLPCSGCHRATDRGDLRWWPPLGGTSPALRVGCVACVTMDGAGWAR